LNLTLIGDRVRLYIMASNDADAKGK